MRGLAELILTGLLLPIFGQRTPPLNLTWDTQTYSYLSPVSFGSSQVPLSLMLDTDLQVRNTQLSIVMSAECKECEGVTYDQSKSTTFLNKSTYYSMETINGVFGGYLSSDVMTLFDSDFLMVDFVLVTKAQFTYDEVMEGVLVRPI